MSASRRGLGTRRGFTLLEAVLAIAILSSVTIVCVGMRAQSLASSRRIEARHALQRDTQTIFDMLTAGLLPPSESASDAGVRRWRGEHQGSTYEIEGTRATLPNPVAGGIQDKEHPLSDRVVMWRYTLKYRGVETEFWWHR